MKKLNIFLLLLLAVSCFFVNGNIHAKAESTYTIKLTTNAIYNLEKTNLEKYLFYADYVDNNYITFDATLYNGTDPVALDGLTYTWTDVTNEDNKTVLSNNSKLALDKICSETGSHLIYVGTKHYQISITGSGVEISQTLTVDITDTSNQIIVTKMSEPFGMDASGAYLIDKNSVPFQVQSILSKLKVDCTTNWFLKTPNSSSFDLLASGNVCSLSPASLVTSTNGFGEYKLFAGAQSSSILYTSEIITFKASAGTVVPENYHITSKVVDNSKAEVQAFTYTLENASLDGIDFSKVIWYVNGVRQAKGETFTYEPTNNEKYVVEVKYKGASLTSLGTIETTPKSTGTLKMILFIAGGVAVISVIFGLVVKAFNKRRDNIW